MQYPEPIAKLIDSYMKLPALVARLRRGWRFIQLI